jgi:hypothetical protein
MMASSVFHILRFPHQGKNVIIHQLDYITRDLHNVATNNFPFLGQSSLKSVGVGLPKDSLLMGVFPLPSPATLQVATLNMISTQVLQSLESLDPLAVPGPYEHSSFPVSSSLKNEIDVYEHSLLSL